MIHPDAFYSDKPIPRLNVPVNSLMLHGREVGQVSIPVSYDDSWKPIFHLGEFGTLADVMPTDDKISLKAIGTVEDIDLLVTSAAWREDSGLVCDAQLRIEPATLGSLCTGSRFEAVILNPPKFLSQPISLVGFDGQAYELNSRRSKFHNVCSVTSNAMLSSSDILDQLSNLNRFLTFVKGSNCGLGNLWAFDETGSVVCQVLGFTRKDSAKWLTNWYDIEINASLPEIYRQYSIALQETATARALHQSINFYRAANVARHVSLEVGIATSCSALESLANFVLEYRAGWSARLMKERSITSSDKLRAACHYFGIDGDLLMHSPELKLVSKSRNQLDGYDLVGFFRNKLVHQDPAFVATGRQLLECWLLAQWLVETLIFGLIGYRGKMIDRRVYTGWRGTTLSVPLTRP